eukprot:1823932-Pyramimonas_sp.AAC.1
MVTYFVLMSDMRPVASVTPSCITVVPLSGALLRTIWPPRSGCASNRASWGQRPPDDGSDPSDGDLPAAELDSEPDREPDLVPDGDGAASPHRSES